jgi:type II secretory pathway component PulF
MENELLEKLKKIEEKTDKIYSSVEKTRKYFLTTMIITAIMIILPILALIVVIPKLISTYNDIFSF